MSCANAIKITIVTTTCNFRYKGSSRRKHLGHYKKLGLVQDHHVIPQQHRKHPSLHQFDIHSSQNLVVLPTPEFMHLLRPDRYSHSGGHKKYNALVLRMLNTGQDVHEILDILKRELRFSTGKLLHNEKHLS